MALDLKKILEIGYGQAGMDEFTRIFDAPADEGGKSKNLQVPASSYEMLALTSEEHRSIKT